MASAWGGFFIEGWKEAQKDVDRRRQQAVENFNTFTEAHPYADEEQLQNYAMSIGFSDPAVVPALPNPKVIEGIAKENQMQKQKEEDELQKTLMSDQLKTLQDLFKTQKGVLALGAARTELGLPFSGSLGTPTLSAEEVARADQRGELSLKAKVVQERATITEAPITQAAGRASKLKTMAGDLNLGEYEYLKDAQEEAALRLELPIEQVREFITPQLHEQSKRNYAIDRFDKANNYLRNTIGLERSPWDPLTTTDLTNTADAVFGNVSNRSRERWIEVNKARLDQINSDRFEKYSAKMYDDFAKSDAAKSAKSYLKEGKDPRPAIDSFIQSRAVPKHAQGALAEYFNQAMNIQATSEQFTAGRDERTRRQETAARLTKEERADIKSRFGTFGLVLGDIGYDVDDPLMQDFMQWAVDNKKTSAADVEENYKQYRSEKLPDDDKFKELPRKAGTVPTEAEVRAGQPPVVPTENVAEALAVVNTFVADKATKRFKIMEYVDRQVTTVAKTPKAKIAAFDNAIVNLGNQIKDIDNSALVTQFKDIMETSTSAEQIQMLKDVREQRQRYIEALRDLVKRRQQYILEDRQ